MAVYRWRGIDAKGRTVKGLRDADSPRALRALLKREGILATDVQEASRVAGRGVQLDLGRLLRRVSSGDVAISTRQLATLLQSGIPLVEALSALVDQLEHPDLKAAFTDARDRVNEGQSFASALEAHPKVFGPLYVHMVAAGEASGTLETVLGRLAEFLEAQARLKTKVIGALAYPAFMMVLGVGIVMVMMTVVVPKVTGIFEDFQQALPWYTELLIWTSDLFVHGWWLMALLAAATIWGFRRWLATEKGRERWDRFVLRTPLFGKLVLMVAVSRFARTLATLLSSGVPILRAMEITRNVLGNTELMRVVDEARANVREGESIARPLRESGRFPPIVTHMIAIGERSGQLEAMLEHVAASYDQQIDARVTAMTALLEPLMIVFMGTAAGGIAFAILTPLMQINQFVQ